jgi:hypothetical protein
MKPAKKAANRKPAAMKSAMAKPEPKPETPKPAVSPSAAWPFPLPGSRPN